MIMKNFIHILLYIVIINYLTACGVKYDGNEINYSFTMTNKTEGNIKNVVIDTNSCGDMAPDQQCDAGYKYRPDDIKISYETDKIYNLGIDFSAQQREYYFETEALINTGSYDLILEDTYFSLWIVNDSTCCSIDRVGYNLPEGSDPGIISNYGPYISSAGVTIANPGETIWLGFYSKSEVTNFYLLDIDGTSDTINSYWEFTDLDSLYIQASSGSYKLNLDVTGDTNN